MNIPLQQREKVKLRKYSKVLKKFAEKKKKSKKSRQKLIQQSGGFLPILIPVVTSILSELIRNG